MTLERNADGTGTVRIRLVECPFCGESIGPREGQQRNHHSSAAAHLRGCVAFFERMGVDPDERLDGRREAARTTTPA